MNDLTHCHHGKRYTADCPDCDALWLKEMTLPEIIRKSKRAAHFAINNPGLIERDVAMQIAALNAVIVKLAAELLASNRTRSR